MAKIAAIAAAGRVTMDRRVSVAVRRRIELIGRVALFGGCMQHEGDFTSGGHVGTGTVETNGHFVRLELQ